MEKLGGNYFASSLRNRYQTEPDCQSKSSFVYQIKDSLAQSKFIAYAHCNLFIISLEVRPFIQRTKLFLKGRSKQFQEKQ